MAYRKDTLISHLIQHEIPGDLGDAKQAARQRRREQLEGLSREQLEARYYVAFPKRNPGNAKQVQGIPPPRSSPAHRRW